MDPRPALATLLVLAPVLLAGCTGTEPEPCSPAGAKMGGDPLCFRSDGWVLQGEVLEAGPDAPVAILTHGLAEGRGTLSPLALDLNRSGVTVLAYDARGHGQSTTFRDETRTVDEFSRVEYWGMPRDVAAARDQVETGDRPLALAGASLGANAVLVHGERAGGVDGLALLSPGLDYRGLETRASAAGYEEPLYMAASEGDDYAHESVRELANETASDEVTVDVVDGTAHGTQLLDGHVGDRVANWTAEALGVANGTSSG